jgi:ankyrin repeat protein
MTKRVAHHSLFAVFFMLAVLLAGCAHQSTSRTVDVPALLNAIALDDASRVRDTVESAGLGANLNIPAPGYPDGTPLLTVAAREASLNVMRYLLTAGADPNARTPLGETAMMMAAFFSEDWERGGTAHERHDRAVELLLQAGASVENEPYNYTPLSYAAYKGRQSVMRFLLEHGARVDGDANGGMCYVNTPLMMAAIQGHYDIALALLRAGADPRIRILHGHTAAELAAKYNHRHLANVLRCAENLPLQASFEASCVQRSAAVSQ